MLAYGETGGAHALTAVCRCERTRTMASIDSSFLIEKVQTPGVILYQKRRKLPKMRREMIIVLSVRFDVPF